MDSLSFDRFCCRMFEINFFSNSKELEDDVELVEYKVGISKMNRNHIRLFLSLGLYKTNKLLRLRELLSVVDTSTCLITVHEFM